MPDSAVGNTNITTLRGHYITTGGQIQRCKWWMSFDHQSGNLTAWDSGTRGIRGRGTVALNCIVRGVSGQWGPSMGRERGGRRLKVVGDADQLRSTGQRHQDQETPPINPADLIDLDRYPLLSSDSSGYAAAVASARVSLTRIGAAELEGFINPLALEVLLSEAEALAPLAWRDKGRGTAYLTAPDENQTVGHPRRWSAPRALGAVAYDLFPLSSALRSLYEWDPLMAFIENILGRGGLYRYADSCGALNLSVMRAGDLLQWHFDQTDFVVSSRYKTPRKAGTSRLSR